MDIFFQDPSAIPLPPDEVRILDLEVAPYPDGRRVRILIELTPFQKYPSGEIKIMNSAGTVVAVSNFIEAVTPKLEMTLHLRALDSGGQYRILMTLFYNAEIKEQTEGDQIVGLPEKNIVDHFEKHFQITE